MASETTPLLNGGTSKSTTPWSTRVKSHLTVNVSKQRTDLLMLIGFLITGLLDSSAILVWNSFVSMQTGNTIYVGLGLADPNGGTRWIKAAVSIASFGLGSFLFARWHRALGARRRWVMAGSYLIQTLLIVAAATILMLDYAPEHDLRWELVAGIALVASSAGGQAVSSRAVELNMLSTVVLTNIYCDLFGDAKLFVRPTQNRQRNQRLGAAVCLLAGAVAGGALGKTGNGIVISLWIGAGLKLVLTVAWLLWKADEEEEG